MAKHRWYETNSNRAIKSLADFIAAFLMISVSVANAQSLLETPEKIQGLLEQKEITEQQIPNPHWDPEGCVSCHVGEAGRNDNKLRSPKINKLCNYCHKSGESHSIIHHPVDISPSNKMLNHMPKTFSGAIKKSGGIMNCLTCHDVKQVCTGDRERLHVRNQKFFRGGSYNEDRTQLCFSCHDESMYERLNPHKQIAENGAINEQTCYVCHASVPDEEVITDIGQLYFNVENNYSSVDDDYSLMCNGCHPWKPHPGGSFSFQMNKVVDHLVVPSEKIMRLLKASDIYFPLEPGTRRVFCGTCHNVHEKGVIKKPRSAKGAGSKHFLRDQDICAHCHAK